MNKVGFLEDLIIKKFKLFQNFRSQQQDQKIFDRVILLCVDEVVNFFQENFFLVLENKGLEKIEQVEEIIQKLLKDKIILWRLKIRIEKFLDNLLFQTTYNAVFQTRKKTF